MAKAIIEYNLNDPDDRMAHFRAVKSVDMASALFELSYNFRKRIEHTVDAMELKGENVSTYDVIDIVMKELLEVIQDENEINIDELIN